MTLDDQYKQLQEELKQLNKVAIAYSSGVDSTLLLYVAKETLGKENVLAITATSHVFPKREYQQSLDFCKLHDIHQIILEVDELEIAGFKENPVNRCYLCKKELFNKMQCLAKDHGFDYLLEGSNMDDLGDYRPGLKAIEELKIISPLRDAQLYKSQIRELSKQFNLPTYNKPSYACLASRFVYGEMITKDKLKQVEQAEDYLHDLGFKQYRVRIHGNLARIEVEEEAMDVLIKNRLAIFNQLKDYGFDYVTVDLRGYRTGSMNETIKKE